MLRILLLLVFVGLVAGAVVTRPLAYIKVRNNQGISRPFNGSADRMAYDSSRKYLYVIGTENDMLTIFDLDDPTNPTEVFSKIFNENVDGLPKAIAFCRSGMTEQFAIAFAHKLRLNEGHLEVFNAYQSGGSLTQIGATTSINYDPIAVQYDSVCRLIVVACQGLPGVRDGESIDPLPHVDIIQRFGDSWNTESINFGTLNVKGNVRYVYQIAGSGHSISNDLEPSDLAIDSDDNVYVSFMPNNGIAKFSLNNIPSTIDIFGLGFKLWNDTNSDTSDLDDSIDDSKINLAKHKIRSFYQPGAIDLLKYGNTTYVATANTGAYKRYTMAKDGVDFEEAIRASTINPTILNDNMDPDLKNELYDVAQLGQLFVSSLRYPSDGWNDFLGKIDDIYMYGGRSWSLYEATGFTSHYDSGGDMEEIVAITNQSVFNGDCVSAAEKPADSKDSRSPYMGPEPRSITTTMFNGTQIVAIGSGRMGGIFLYKVVPDTGMNMPTGQFESYNRLGVTTENWETLYNNGNAGTPYISDLKFVQNNGRTLLLALGSQLGVVAVHEVYEGTFP